MSSFGLICGSVKQSCFRPDDAFESYEEKLCMGDSMQKWYAGVIAVVSLLGSRYSEPVLTLEHWTFLIMADYVMGNFTQDGSILDHVHK